VHYYFNFEKKGDPFDFLPSVCWTHCHNLYTINHYWTTFETLAEIDRDCKERAWEIAISLTL